ncbi:hypothetical protein [Homoserinimonas sp. A520]
MGTNGAFGGSGAAAWGQVRDQWTSLGSSSRGGSDTADADIAPAGSDSAYDPLISAIAAALIGEDPDARRPSVPTFPLSATLPRRGGGRGGAGGGGGTGGAGGGSSSGGRRVTSQAARGGSAIGAAAAYRDRDAAALAEYGLTLDDLDALSPRMRYARILDVAIGQAGHPDEQAMRQASLEQIKALLAGGPGAASIPGLVSIRDFIGELTVRLGLIELRDQILANTVTAKQAHQRETGLRQWVKAKVSRLDLGRYGTVSTRDFHQVARQMSADVLRLLKGE